jgi:hypothetical protein
MGSIGPEKRNRSRTEGLEWITMKVEQAQEGLITQGPM